MATGLADALMRQWVSHKEPSVHMEREYHYVQLSLVRREGTRHLASWMGIVVVISTVLVHGSELDSSSVEISLESG